MRKFLALMAAGGIALGLGVPVEAQDGPMYTTVSAIEVAPGHVEDFAAQVRAVAEAAEAAGLGEEFRWDVYAWDNTFYFLNWAESLSVLEDQDRMMREFQGTEQMDEVMAAFEAVGDLDWRGGNTTVARGRPELSYMPANPAMAEGEHGGVYVLEQWPLPSAGPAFEESVKDIMGMLAEMGGPYPVFVSQDVIGDGNYTFAVPFDDLASFYGENSLEAGLQASGMAEAWGAHVAEHQQLLADVESWHVMYRPDLSFRPDLAAAGATGGN